LTPGEARLPKVKFFIRSPQLEDLTQAFELYTQRATKANLEQLADRFSAWRNLGTQQVQSERATIGASAENDLQFTITQAKASNLVIKDKATNVTNKGWTLKLWTKAEYPSMDAVQANLMLPALKPSEITRINEAMARSKLAVEYARDAMIDLAKQNAIGNVPSAEEQLYLDFFGAFTQARAQKVLANYKILYNAFDGVPVMVDVRNTVLGMQCYAGVQRGRIVAGLEVFVGRAFFLAGAVQDRYDTSSSSTVGTLIHEFAHGSFNAVDAPPVDGNGNWVLQPMHLNDPDHDDYGASPDVWIQASTIE